MKLQITFHNTHGINMQGLQLLDTVRKHIHNIGMEQVADNVYIGTCQTVDLDEETARRSGRFDNTNERTIYVEANSNDWKELFHSTGTKVSAYDGKIVPVFEFDAQPLIEAWANQGYEIGKRLRYPATETD